MYFEMKQAKTHIGVALVTAAVSVLTSMEAGALAGGGPCVDFDSALGPVRPLHQAGRPPLSLGEIGWGEKMFHYLPAAAGWLTRTAPTARSPCPAKSRRIRCCWSGLKECHEARPVFGAVKVGKYGILYMQ